MKRLSMAMTALAVMGLMTMVSCRKPNVNNVVPGAARTVTFNATTESNGGSKTTLEGLDVKWSAGDQISVNGNDDTHKLKLEDGAGTTFGSFTGTITATAPYLVGYPADATNDGTNITFTIDDEQDGDPDFDSKLPMAAYTADENGDLSFKNMVNVLKLDLTGSQTINMIEVMSEDEFLSGSFTVGTTLSPSAIASGTKKITIDYTGNQLGLNTEPTVYVVLPVFGSSESTITVKFTGDDGVMTVGPKALTGSTTPNHRYNAPVAVTLVAPVETDEWINFNDEAMGVEGLPKWSKYNLGVDKSNLDHAYDWYGDYYAWAGVEPYYTSINWSSATSCSPTWKSGYSDGYSWAHCPYTNGTYSNDNEAVFTKYVPQNKATTYGYNGYYDDKTVLDLSDPCDDASRAVLGGAWRMPTGGASGEWVQLKRNTLFVWTTSYRGISNLRGYVVYKVRHTDDKGVRDASNCSTSADVSNDGGYSVSERIYSVNDGANYQPHMFIPATGVFNGLSNFSVGTQGYYWSCSAEKYSVNCAGSVFFTSGYLSVATYFNRNYGFPIRPVR